MSACFCEGCNAMRNVNHIHELNTHTWHLYSVNHPDRTGGVIEYRQSETSTRHRVDVCQGPDCDNPVHSARGTRRFCSTRCRVAAFRSQKQDSKAVTLVGEQLVGG